MTGERNTCQTLACYLVMKGTGAPVGEGAGKAQPQARGRLLYLVFRAIIVGMASKKRPKRPLKEIWSPKKTILIIFLPT